MKTCAFPLTLALALLMAVEFGPLVGASRAQETWNWGELAYSRTYDTKLEIPNDCPCSVEVTITPRSVEHPPLKPMVPKNWTAGNPYLTITDRVIVPPGGGSVPARIKTPAAPPIPRTPTGVALNDLTLVEGILVLEGKPLPDCCNPKNCESSKRYDITGHIHLDPGSGGSGFEPVNCDRYWDDEQDPPSSVEEHCRDRLRQLAQNYIASELAEEREEDPGAWSWLPSTDEIAGMSSGELLGIKARAEAIRRSTAATDGSSPPSR